MLNRADFAERLQSCADAKSSVDEFEDWFEDSSWNVHQSGDRELTTAVFRIESWLSARNEGRLSDNAIRSRFGDLANAIAPFAPKPIAREDRLIVTRRIDIPGNQVTVGAEAVPVRIAVLAEPLEDTSSSMHSEPASQPLRYFYAAV